jgi:hypothetical protein
MRAFPRSTFIDLQKASEKPDQQGKQPDQAQIRPKGADKIAVKKQESGPRKRIDVQQVSP